MNGHGTASRYADRLDSPRYHRRMPMSIAHIALLLLLPSSLLAQSAPQFDRRDRIVLWSRHFDEIAQPNGPLNCPEQPGRVYGFESPRSQRTTGRLLVRVFGPDTTALGKH